MKQDAASPDYETLFRDIDARVGDAVHYTATVGQVMETDVDDLYYLFLAVENTRGQYAYGSWLGERVLRGDVIEFWARVLGTESYQTASGAQRTVPAFAIADLEHVETTTATSE